MLHHAPGHQALVGVVPRHVEQHFECRPYGNASVANAKESSRATARRGEPKRSEPFAQEPFVNHACHSALRRTPATARPRWVAALVTRSRALERARSRRAGNATLRQLTFGKR